MSHGTVNTQSFIPQEQGMKWGLKVLWQMSEPQKWSDIITLLLYYEYITKSENLVGIGA